MLLLDTHVVIWLALEPHQISKRATTALREARLTAGGLAISSMTLWEIAMLHAKQRIDLRIPLDTFLERVEAVYRVFTLSRQIAQSGVKFSAVYPADPADRQIGGTALIHGLTLVTADRRIHASHEVPCLW